MKKSVWLGSIIVLTLLFIIVLTPLSTSKERTSNKFAEHLFNYSLPPETSLVAKHQSNGKNFVDGGGSGGYWNVAAVMELSSKLTRNEILAYYQNVGSFPYPKGNQRGVPLELYFKEESRRVERSDGFYYRSQTGEIRTVHSYPLDTNSVTLIKGETKYILQLVSGFDYFLNFN
ncbi:hypothetical protein ACFO9Q_10385 [Paenibacillus sp. GCM10023252]|uniref:hypothetical protein n=1 Tax=Paenibacillus sp. GCM10023252 TaxID=3252649 RepID=UPI00360F5992